VENCYGIKIKNQKYDTIGTIPKSRRKIVETGKIYTPDTQIDDLLNFPSLTPSL